MTKIKGLFMVAIIVATALVVTTYTLTGNNTSIGTVTNGGLATFISAPNSVSNSTGATLNVPSTDLKQENEAEVSVKSKKIQQLNLKSDRLVYLLGEVGMNAMDAAEQITKLSNASAQPIYLILSGPGGSVLTGSAVISAIQASRAPVHTVCLLICASMDAMIHQYGSKRYVTDRTVMMFHQASSGIQGDVSRMLTYTKFISRYVSKIEFEVSKRWNLTLPQYQLKISNELWLDAEDSVSQNVADGIVSLNIPEAPRSKSQEEYRKNTTYKSKAFDIRWIMNYGQ